MKTVILGLFALVLNLASASAWQDQPRGYPPGNGYPQPSYPHNGEFIVRPVGYSIQGQGVIHLSQVLPLGSQFQGRPIEFIYLRATGQGNATVFGDSVALSSTQPLAPYSREYHFLLPYGRNSFGQFQSLYFTFWGN